MAQPYNCIRISGTMPGGEVWSVNPKFAIQGGGAVDDYQILLGWASSVAGLNSNGVLPSVWRQFLSSSAAVTAIRAEYYDETGKLAVVAEFALPSPAAGTQQAQQPFQTACVMSLRTGRPGRSYRGRLYFPALAVNMVASTLRIPDIDRDALATQGATWLRAIANSVGAGQVVQPVVVSQTLGINSVITSVEVGNILDTQRRRRDSLDEAYAVASVPLA